jgi:hypothetical protein
MLRVVAERAAQLREALCQRIRRDRHAWPDGVEQLAARDDSAARGTEIHEHAHRAGCQVNRGVAALYSRKAWSNYPRTNAKVRRVVAFG